MVKYCVEILYEDGSSDNDYFESYETDDDEIRNEFSEWIEENYPDYYDYNKYEI